MKKIIFINVPITTNPEPQEYKIMGNSILKYDGKVMCPINSVLAKTLKSEDNVKIVLIKEEQEVNEDKHYENNIKEELNNINSSIGAKIDYKLIIKPFKETSESHENLFEQLIDELDENVEVSADVSYGAKPLPFIIFNVLTFAAKFCNADIVNIIYGKVQFKKEKLPNGKLAIDNATIFDLSTLYYLNSISNTIKCNNMNEAKKVIKKIISMK